MMNGYGSNRLSRLFGKTLRYGATAGIVLSSCGDVGNTGAEGKDTYYPVFKGEFDAVANGDVYMVDGNRVKWQKPHDGKPYNRDGPIYYCDGFDVKVKTKAGDVIEFDVYVSSMWSGVNGYVANSGFFKMGVNGEEFTSGQVFEEGRRMWNRIQQAVDSMDNVQLRQANDYARQRETARQQKALKAVRGR
jgi:hypothetical protein